MSTSIYTTVGQESDLICDFMENIFPNRVAASFHKLLLSVSLWKEAATQCDLPFLSPLLSPLTGFQATSQTCSAL